MVKQLRATLYIIIENILKRPLTNQERGAIRKVLIVYADAVKNKD